MDFVYCRVSSSSYLKIPRHDWTSHVFLYIYKNIYSVGVGGRVRNRQVEKHVYLLCIWEIHVENENTP
jgi:hypothetical protein